MKRLSILLALAITVFASCEKNGDTPPRSFEGKWMVKKILADPGDGSGRYVDVSNQNASITFGPDTTLSSTSEIFGLNLLAGYKVLDTARVRASFKPHASYPTMIYLYKFIGDTLVLHPPCIEGCGIKLVKATAGQ